MGQVETGAVVINIKAGLTNFKQGMADGSSVATRETRKLAEGIKGQMAEARGSMMLLGEELGVHIPRHLQRLITQIPGVSTLFANMLPLVGVAAALGIVLKLIEKQEAYKEQLRQNGVEVADLTAKEIDRTQGLELQNLKLEDQLSKIRGTPEKNHLAEMLIEAKLKADDLISSLAGVIQKGDDALAKQTTFTGEIARNWESLKADIASGDLSRILTTQSKDALNEQIANVQKAITAVNDAQLKHAEVDPTNLEAMKKALADQSVAYSNLHTAAKSALDVVSQLAPKDAGLIGNLKKEAIAGASGVNDMAAAIKNLSLSVAVGTEGDAKKFGDEVTKLQGDVNSLFDKFKSQTESPFQRLDREASETEKKIRQMAADNPEQFKQAFPSDSVDGVVVAMRHLADQAEDKELQKALLDINKQLDELAKTAKAFPKDVFAGLKSPTLPTLAPNAQGKTAAQKQLDELTNGTDKSAASAEKAAEKIRDAVESDNQKYKEQLALLDKLHDMHLLTDDEFKKGKDQLSGEAAAWKSLGANIGQTIEQAALFGRSWTDALKAILIEVLRVIVQMQVMKAIKESGGSAGQGGFFTSLLTGLFGGGIGGARAGGGDVAPGKGYWVGEKGPEWFSPDSAGSIVPNHALGGGAGRAVQVTNHFHFPNGDVDSFRKSQSQVSNQINRTVRRAAERNS